MLGFLRFWQFDVHSQALGFCKLINYQFVSTVSKFFEGRTGECTSLGVSLKILVEISKVSLWSFETGEISYQVVLVSAWLIFKHPKTNEISGKNKDLLLLKTLCPFVDLLGSSFYHEYIETYLFNCRLKWYTHNLFFYLKNYRKDWTRKVRKYLGIDKINEQLFCFKTMSSFPVF
jgi:hypothetical protein